MAKTLTIKDPGRHPRGWCGLKFFGLAVPRIGIKSPPARVVWIEIHSRVAAYIRASGRHPRGWCGLKCDLVERGIKVNILSPPARVVWIEIRTLTRSIKRKSVATREGGVD